MKVCIIGGGHIGTTLACYIKNEDPQKNVCLYTRRPHLFESKLKCNDIEGKKSYVVSLDSISNDPRVMNDADVIFVALPHFAVEEAFKNISPYVKRGVYIGVIPGGGGCEFFFHKYFSEDATLFGFQRVPFTAKLEVYGKETNLKSWKKFSVVGTLKRERIQEACELIEQCGLKTKKADNYLEIALTPTNPVLHTARTFEIFGKYEKNYEFNERKLFYVGWTDMASETLFAMDQELHEMLDMITGLDTTAIRPLSEHYESPSIEALTKKINSIATFQTVYAPMKESSRNVGKYVADTGSRMFTEDFPWGLAIFRAYCELLNVKTPMMDKVLSWYANYMGVEWFVNGVFCGKDLKGTGIPKRYGIETKEQLLNVYI